jgi:nitrogen-specific signal transduction histidine kinase
MHRSILTMKRRTWLQVGRLIVFGIFILFGVLFLGWFRVGVLYSTVGAAVIVTVALDIFFRKTVPEGEWQLWIVFVLDSILASILIRMAGGFDGPLTALFFIHTFIAGVYLGIRGGVIIAVLDSIMIALMAFFTISGVFDYSPTGSSLGKLLNTLPSSVTFQYALLFVMIYAGFLTITGLISGYLSQHLLFEKGRADGILRQLTEARTMSREILESLSDGILVIDNSGVPVSINNAGRKIFSMGDDWKEGVVNTDIYTMLREFQLSEGMPSVIEVSINNEILECRMGTFLDHEGNALGALVAVTDITETFELKRKLQEQEKLAAIGRLSSTMAHEIRNPLASMSGAAHILKMGTLDWKKTDRMTDLISDQAKRISEIIEGYLELSRSSTVSYTNPVSLEAVAMEAIEVAKQGFGCNSAEVLKNSPDGRITVSLVNSPVDGMVEMNVHDNGPGIPDEVQVQMFDPFFTTKEEGTGLGLFVARKVARDHRGRMDIDSKPGEGTTVRVSIPIAPPDAVAPEAGGN